MYNLSTLYKSLAIALLILGIIIFIVYFYTLTIEGYYVIEIYVENTTIRTITIELPRDEYGEPVYRITEFTSAITYDGESREIEPIITNYNKGYPEIIELPVNLGEGEYKLTGKFVLEEKDYFYNYSKYPWILYGGDEPVYIYPNIKKTITYQLIGLLKEYGHPIVYTLSIATIGLAAYTIYQLGRGILYQQKPTGPLPPTAPTKKKTCEWCSICVRFFKIDVKNANNSQLPGAFIEKLYSLLNEVNDIWEKCCIRFYPCVDSKGKVIARTLDPRKTVEVKVGYGFAKYKSMKIRYDRIRKVDVSKIFKDSNCKSIEMDRGKVKVNYDEYIKAKWDSSGKYKDKEYKKGNAVPANILREFLNDVANAVQRKPNRRKELEDVRDAISKITPQRSRGEIDVMQVLEELIKAYGYPENCIDIVIVDDIDDKSTMAKEEGFGAMPGRISIISSRVVDRGMADVLAHELGHNLSLPHINKFGNLMEAKITGTALNDEQCKKAYKNCMGEECRKFTSEICDNGNEVLSKFKEKQSLIEEREEIKENIRNLKEELKKVDEKSKKCRRIIYKLKKEANDAEFIYKKVKSFADKVIRLRNRGKIDQLENLIDEIEEDLENKREKERKYLRNPKFYRTSLSITRRWIKVLEKQLEAVKDPANVVKELKNEMDRKKQEYKECREYAWRSNKIKKNIRNKIKTNEDALKDLEKKIRELEKILKK